MPINPGAGLRQLGQQLFEMQARREQNANDNLRANQTDKRLRDEADAQHGIESQRNDIMSQGQAQALAIAQQQAEATERQRQQQISQFNQSLGLQAQEQVATGKLQPSAAAGSVHMPGMVEGSTLETPAQPGMTINGQSFSPVPPEQQARTQAAAQQAIEDAHMQRVHAFAEANPDWLKNNPELKDKIFAQTLMPGVKVPESNGPEIEKALREGYVNSLHDPDLKSADPAKKANAIMRLRNFTENLNVQEGLNRSKQSQAPMAALGDKRAEEVTAAHMLPLVEKAAQQALPNWDKASEPDRQNARVAAIRHLVAHPELLPPGTPVTAIMGAARQIIGEEKQAPVKDKSDPFADIINNALKPKGK